MKIKLKKNNLIVILVLSLTINLLVFFIDTIPLVMRKMESEYFKNTHNVLEQYDPEKQIVRRSLEMAESRKPIMIYDEDELKQRGFTSTLINFRIGKTEDPYKIYNYSRAFLYYGLSEYFIKKKDLKLLKKFQHVFDEIIDEKGNPKFKFDRVDQVPFGLASLNLYKVYKEDKYLVFSNFIYRKLIEMSDKKGIILYRENSSMQFCDVLGMIVPFLVEYEKVKLDGGSIKLAKKQLDFYIDYGVDKETFLPSHGIELKSKIKIGPTNWGRGIGWYLLGLSKYSEETEQYDKELKGVFNTLNQLKNKEGVWTQFPGSSDAFDASTTTMFMYSLNLLNKNLYTKSDIMKLLGNYISKEGELQFTSGDTYGINNYNKSFGPSELSQGVLLLLLSTTE